MAGLAMADVTGFAEIADVLDRLGKDAPKALADAINHTSNQARIALREEMQSVFVSPTPFTLNAIAVDIARPRGDPEGSVFVKDTSSGKNNAPTEWFKPQVFGGERVQKASERTLHSLGVLPAGMYTVPAKAARRDSYGNMSRGQIVEIIASLKRSKDGAKDEKYFVIRRGSNPIGIAQRAGRTVQVVIAFTKEPNYTSQLDYSDVVMRVADENLEANIDKAVVKLLS